MWVFGCFGVYMFGVWLFFRCSLVHDISEDEKGDQRGSPKLVKIFGCGKTRTSLRGRPKHGKSPKKRRKKKKKKVNWFKPRLV